MGQITSHHNDNHNGAPRYMLLFINYCQGIFFKFHLSFTLEVTLTV